MKDKQKIKQLLLSDDKSNHLIAAGLCVSQGYTAEEIVRDCIYINHVGDTTFWVTGFNCIDWYDSDYTTTHCKEYIILLIKQKSLEHLTDLMNEIKLE